MMLCLYYHNQILQTLVVIISFYEQMYAFIVIEVL